MIADFASAAVRAVDAGFDLIESLITAKMNMAAVWKIGFALHWKYFKPFKMLYHKVIPLGCEFLQQTGWMMQMAGIWNLQWVWQRH
ncbi:Uncharacterised protein [Mycobacteroides abscessus subsp. abscessus]|nr:Uncharacterised protein [Mycobacteroides abscessus subsp. abscessus]